VNKLVCSWHRRWNPCRCRG